MAGVLVREALTVTRPALRLRISGAFWDNARVETIVRRAGPIASEAVVSFPGLYVGAAVPEGALVEIVDEAGRVVFRGWSMTPIGSEDGRSRSDVRMVVRDVVGLMDRVFVGQASLRGESLFLRRDQISGAASGWTIESVLSAILGPYSLEPAWLAILGLGDVSAISRTRAQDVAPLLRLTTTSVLEALRRLTSLVPDVGWRVRYAPDGRSLIDFFLWGDTTLAARQLRAPLGSRVGIVTACEIRRDRGQLATRVVAYGEPTRVQVTFVEGHATAPLEPLWDGATLIGSTPSAAEMEVLENPLLATPGSALFRDDLGGVFRRYRIPREILAAWGIEGTNVWETASGARVPVQIFTEKTVLVEDTENVGVSLAVLVPNEYEMLEGSLDAERGIVELRQPATFLQRTGPDPVDGFLLKEYGRAVVYLTVTLTNRSVVGRWMSPSDTDRARGGFDTGVRGSGVEGLEGSGLASSWANNTAEAAVVGAGAEGLADATGMRHLLGCVVWDPEAGVWLNLVAAGDTPLVLQDDRALLAQLALAELAERARVRTDVAATVPAALLGIQPGDCVRLLGRGIDSTRLTVRAVDVDVWGMETSIDASDQVPPVSRTDRSVRRQTGNGGV